MRGVLGIDVGAQGGVAIINDDKIVVEPTQTLGGILNHKWLGDFILEHRDDFSMAWVEKVGAMPGQGVTSMFSFGRNLGGIEGVLTALGVPFGFVRPQEWQEAFFAPSRGAQKLTPKQKKERCVLAAQRTFPKVNLLATERSKVPHLGMVDALLIAEWGRRNN